MCVRARARRRGYNNCTLAVYFIDFGSQRTSRWRVSIPAPYSGGPGFKSWSRDRLLWLGEFLVSPSGIFPESASNQGISRVFCMTAKALFTNHPVVGGSCMLWASETVITYLRQNCRIQVEKVTGGGGRTGDAAKVRNFTKPANLLAVGTLKYHWWVCRYTRRRQQVMAVMLTCTSAVGHFVQLYWIARGFFFGAMAE